MLVGPPMEPKGRQCRSFECGLRTMHAETPTSDGGVALDVRRLRARQDHPIVRSNAPPQPLLFPLILLAHIVSFAVKLHDQGLEAIEVTDDGSGVPASSRPLMAAKHATSKLRRFDDLYSDDRGDGDEDDDGDEGGDGDHDNDGGGAAHAACAPTLGFRGEALFCLANLSRSLEASTRTTDDAVGERFEFDREGNVVEGTRRNVPRRVGTTVTVRGLFEAVPVRRADLKKRIKAQRMKLTKMMQGCE